MNYLPKSDTSTRDTISKSPRNSYESTAGSEYSTRNSYASISDRSVNSARTSYSSIFDPPARVASFSRTSDSFIPDSLSTTPSSSRDSSPNSPERWKHEDSDSKNIQVPSEVAAKNPKTHVRTGSKDGPSALKELENVQNIICVAFGAFDRYYISWEDTSGDFHQESHKLPEKLHEWLFPADGSTRDLPTLQVSFGSNDEFFASDKLGKTSYRESISPSEKKGPPSLANVARGLMRRKAYTVSSPTGPRDLQLNLTEKLVSPRLERRNTYLEGHPSPRIDPVQPMTPINEIENRSQERESWTPKHERRRSIFPLSENQLKRLERRPTYREDQPKVEVDSAQPMDSAEGSAHSLPWPRPQSPAQENRRNIIPLSLSEDKLSRMGMRSQTTKQERRASILVSNPPVRVSWPDRRSILQARERIQAPSQEVVGRVPVVKSGYVNAGVQTEIPTALPEIFQPPSPIIIDLPPEHSLRIGEWSDFFREQYRLGDALGYV